MSLAVFQKSLNVFGQHVHFEIDLLARSSQAKIGHFECVRDQRNGE
jgi:hypothetical protein